MTYIRKTQDEYQVLANYGYGHGWEEVCAESSYSEGRARLREYRENMPEYPYKLICKRIPKQEQ